MTQFNDSMMNPSLEDLLERTGSKFDLVTLASLRARQINSYFGQLGDAGGPAIPPQVASTARKPLSIAFEEIAADKIVARRTDTPDAPEESAADTDSPTE